MAETELRLVRADALGELARELERASGEALRMELLPRRGLLNLRGPGTEAFARAVATSFGVALPLEPNRWAGTHDRAATWLGPDEWLLQAPDGEGRRIERALCEAFVEEPWFSVTDVSQNYMRLCLSGRHARELLARGCAFDLHPSAFNTGACAQTLLAKTRVILRAMDGDAIEVWVRNSFACYAVQWLLNVSAGFQEAQ